MSPAFGRASVALVLSLTAFGPARAGDASCLWNGLPSEYREAFIAAYPAEGQRALLKLDAPGAVLGPVLVHCGVRSHSENLSAIHALMAYAFDQAAARELFDQFKIGAPIIDAAWDQLPRDERAAFTEAVLQGADDGHPASSSDPAARQAALSVVDKVATSAGITDPNAQAQLGIYLTWKAVLPHYEDGF